MRTAIPGLGISTLTLPDEPKRSAFLEGTMLPTPGEIPAPTNGTVLGTSALRMRIPRTNDNSERLSEKPF
jgi:hypothetical protein